MSFVASRRTARVARLLLPASAVLLFAACIGEPEPVPDRYRVPTHPQPSEALVGLTTAPQRLDLVVGDTITFTPMPVVLTASATVQYMLKNSDSTRIELIRRGDLMQVVALEEGTATITISAIGSAPGFGTSTRAASLPVTVTAPDQ